MDKDAFLKASERAEKWVRQIAEAREWLESGGDELIAWGFIRQLECDVEPYRHDSVLESTYGQLAAIADEVIRHEWGGKSFVYASVHELVDDTRRWLYVHIILPSMNADNDERRTTAGRQFSKYDGVLILPPESVALIKRERAKLLAAWNGHTEWSDKPHVDAENLMPKSKLSREEQAIAVLIQHPDWTKKRIAAHIGCNEKQLAPSRMPMLAAAVAASKAKTDPSRKVRRGSKGSDGTLEAWEGE